MFLLQTEENVMNKIDFIHTQIIPKNIDAYIKKFHSFPAHIGLPVDLKEFAVFPDIFLKPYPMVSEMLMDVLRMYRIEPFFKRIVLYDRNSEDSRNYFLLYVDEDTRSLYNDFKLTRSQEYELICIISLDFAESILRRGALGIELIEWMK